MDAPSTAVAWVQNGVTLLEYDWILANICLRAQKDDAKVLLALEPQRSTALEFKHLILTVFIATKDAHLGSILHVVSTTDCQAPLVILERVNPAVLVHFPSQLGIATISQDESNIFLNSAFSWLDASFILGRLDLKGAHFIAIRVAVLVLDTRCTRHYKPGESHE